MARQREVTLAAAEQARQTTNTLRTLIDAIPAGVLVSDDQGQITLANPTAVAILGGTATGTSPESASDYVLLRSDGSPFPTTDLPLSRAIERGEFTRDLEILVRCADGNERIILAAGSPVRDQSGRTTGAVAVFEDVTKRLSAVKLLEERERLQVAIANFGRSALAGVDVTRLWTTPTSKPRLVSAFPHCSGNVESSAASAWSSKVTPTRLAFSARKPFASDPLLPTT